mmetsp:Transcript_8362/g.18040  ORF Transcript_8362/g.18040 Transcript_8362/m.18040 type:complete len:80 (-) Transcript_8362:2354-2593(-)
MRKWCASNCKQQRVQNLFRLYRMSIARYNNNRYGIDRIFFCLLVETMQYHFYSNATAVSPNPFQTPPILSTIVASATSF